MRRCVLAWLVIVKCGAYGPHLAWGVLPCHSAGSEWPRATSPPGAAHSTAAGGTGWVDVQLVPSLQKPRGRAGFGPISPWIQTLEL